MRPNLCPSRKSISMLTLPDPNVEVDAASTGNCTTCGLLQPIKHHVGKGWRDYPPCWYSLARGGMVQKPRVRGNTRKDSSSFPRMRESRLLKAFPDPRPRGGDPKVLPCFEPCPRGILNAVFHVSGPQPHAKNGLVHRDVVKHPLERDVVKTTLDVSFQYPWRRVGL